MKYYSIKTWLLLKYCKKNNIPNEIIGIILNKLISKYLSELYNLNYIPKINYICYKQFTINYQYIINIYLHL